MKIISLFTPSHEPLVTRFLANLKDDCQLHLSRSSLPNCNGNYNSPEFVKAVKARTYWVQEVLRTANAGDIFVMSDVDIEFYQPIEPYVKSIMDDPDISFAFQSENPQQTVACTGFQILRNDEHTAYLLETILSKDWHHQLGDQQEINDALKDDSDLASRCKLLDGRFWCPPWGSDWVNKETILCHANSTDKNNSVAAKLKLLDEVQDFRNKRL